MQARLEIKPLGVNAAWQGKRFKTNEYQAFEKQVLLSLKATRQKFEGMLRVEYFFGFSSPLADIDGPIKLIQDILCKKYGFDDRQIFELNARKCIVPKGKEFIEFSIENLLPF